MKSTSRSALVAVVVGVAVVVLLVVAVLLVTLRQQSAATTTGKLVGSGREAMKEFDLSGFDRIEADAGFQVAVKPGDYGVKVWTDDNVTPYLDVTVAGKTLKLSIKSDEVNSVTTHSLRAEVQTPDLVGLDLDGGSHAQVTGFASDQPLSFTLNGGSRLTGDVTGANTKVDAEGGSRLELSGRGGDLDVKASGGSDVLLSQYPVQDVRVDLSGGGRTEVSASGKVAGTASGGAMLQVSGNPSSVDVKTAGGSEVQRK